MSEQQPHAPVESSEKVEAPFEIIIPEDVVPRGDIDLTSFSLYVPPSYRKETPPPAAVESEKKEEDTIITRAKQASQESILSGVQTLLSIVGALAILTLAGYGFVQLSMKTVEKPSGYDLSSVAIKNKASSPEEVNHREPTKKEKVVKVESPPSSDKDKAAKANGKATLPQGHSVFRMNQPPTWNKETTDEMRNLLWSRLQEGRKLGLATQVSPQEMLAAGRKAEVEGRMDDARKLYGKASEQGSVQASYRMGLVAMEKDKKQAENHFRKVLESNPRHMPSYNNLALVLKHKGDIDGAINVTEKALQVDGEYAHLLNTAGNLWRKKGDMEKAMTYYRRALKVDSKFYPSHYNLAECLLFQGEGADAQSHFKTALAGDLSIKVRAYNGLGKVEFFQGKYESAAENFEKARRLGSTPETVWKNLVVTYQKLKKPRRALKVLQEWLANSPQSLEARVQKALILMKLKEYSAAVQDLEKVLKSRPKSVQAHFVLALAYEKLGNFFSALEHYEKVVKLDRSHVRAYNNLGLIYGEDESTRNKALKYFTQALQIDPQFASARLNRAFVYLKLREYKKGLADLERYYQLSPPQGKRKARLDKLRAQLKQIVSSD